MKFLADRAASILGEPLSFRCEESGMEVGALKIELAGACYYYKFGKKIKVKINTLKELMLYEYA